MDNAILDIKVFDDDDSRTKDYLSELVEEEKIIANGANKNRTYSLI